MAILSAMLSRVARTSLFLCVPDGQSGLTSSPTMLLCASKALARTGADDKMPSWTRPSKCSVTLCRAILARNSLNNKDLYDFPLAFLQDLL
jgi:hypothetical protein